MKTPTPQNALRGSFIAVILGGGTYLGTVIPEWKTPITILSVFISLIITALFTWEKVVNYFQEIKTAAEGATSLASEGNAALISAKETIESHNLLVESLSGDLQELKRILESNKTQTNLNAEFVDKGFIGLQNKAVELERIPVSSANQRYAIHGHLPSHIRTDDLSEAMASELYRGWSPTRLIPLYANLINSRRQAHQEFVNGQGQCWEIYSAEALTAYAQGETPFDEIVDPVEERLARFQRLQDLVKLPNYHLLLFLRKMGINLTLRFHENSGGAGASQGAVLIDLRLPYSVTIFDESCYGAFSQSRDVYEAYRKKVDSLISENIKSKLVISDKQQQISMISGWIAAVR